MLRHLSGKWARAVPAGGAHSILVHPAHDCPITLRGMKWGGPACDPQLKVRSSSSWGAARYMGLRCTVLPAWRTMGRSARAYAV